KMLAVLPGKDEDKIPSLGKLPAVPKGLPFAVQISMVTPHRAFRSIEQLQIPKSIAKLRLRATPLADGGAKLELELLDESPEKAAENAPLMTEQWGKVQAAAMLALLFLDEMTFRAEGSTIVGSTTFTKEQL